MTYRIPDDMAEAIQDVLNDEHGPNHGTEVFSNEYKAVAIVIGDDFYGNWPLSPDKVAEISETLRSRGFDFETAGNTLIVRQAF